MSEDDPGEGFDDMIATIEALRTELSKTKADLEAADEFDIDIPSQAKVTGHYRLVPSHVADDRAVRDAALAEVDQLRTELSTTRQERDDAQQTWYAAEAALADTIAERDRFRDHYPTDHRLDYCVCGESWTENHDGRTPHPYPA